jgi:hypothetical protein
LLLPFRGRPSEASRMNIRLPGDGYVYVVDTSRGLLISPEL